MKRILIEVFCGLAALVSMASFHHQIARLEEQQVDVGELEHRLERSLADNRGGQQELEALRQQILEQTEARMASLERQLQVATAGSDQARMIAEELEQARRDASTFRTQMSSDFERTKELVDAYISEVRSKERNAAMRLSKAQGQIATLASSIYCDTDLLTRNMLLPTVQLNGEETVGSGTIVFSGPNAKNDGRVETYALTSYHVVRNILADTPKARRTGFDVTIYLPEKNEVAKGHMVASRPEIDAALVRIEIDRELPYVANVLPRPECGQVGVWDPVRAVGCPLGNDPVPSKGEVTSLHNELNGANYWMINAPTYFGNSGGGIYLAETRQLIGVFSKIYTHGKGQPVVVPHMGLCTPIVQIYDWLEQEDLLHLLQSQTVQRVDLSQLAAPPK